MVEAVVEEVVTPSRLFSALQTHTRKLSFFLFLPPLFSPVGSQRRLLACGRSADPVVRPLGARSLLCLSLSLTLCSTPLAPLLSSSFLL